LKKRLILVAFLILLVGVGGSVFWGQYRKRTGELYYSGMVEATQANLAFQMAGRINAVKVDEGQVVDADQILAVLDQDSALANRDQALANLMRAESTLKQMEMMLVLNRQILPAEIEKAEAAVQALRAQLLELETGYRDQDIQQAFLALESKRIAMEDAHKDQKRDEQLLQRKVIPEKVKDASTLRYETAFKEHERAQQASALLKEGYRKESIQVGRSRLNEAQAVLKLARINLKKVEVTEKEVDVARAQERAAQAALELAEIQLRNTELRSSFKGVVTSRNAEPGEVVTTGQEVISISDLSEVDLKIFVDETEIGRVKPGQKVDVKIDTYADKTYQGKVAFISPEGEFTPKIIQTRKERVKLVYLVKIKIPNPDFELKSGMPADAWFR
jgi:HlyD family secretion protein